MKQAPNSKVVGRLVPSPSLATQRKQAKEKQRSGWEEVLDVARQHLKRFIGLEPKVLQGDDPEAIHDFRVASRRLQQVLDLLYPKPRPKKIRKLRRVIQRCRQAFSTVRNCDVLIQRVNGSLACKRTGQRESWMAFREHLETRRLDAFQQAVGKLSRLNLSDFYVRLQGCLNAPPHSLSNPGGTVSDESQPGYGVEVGTLEDRLVRELQLTWEAFDTRVSHSQKERDPDSLHAVRIAAKRLRYLIEVIGELGVADTKKILSRLRRLQQHLGDWHDLEVIEQMMAEMLARPRFLRSNINLAIKMRRLMLKNQKSKTIYEKKYFDSAIISSGCSELKAWVIKVASKPVPLDSEI